jgi:hypothetical protein
MTLNASAPTRSPTPPCASDATNGSPPGAFDAIANEAIAAYDRVIGLDLSDVAVDGSLHNV